MTKDILPRSFLSTQSYASHMLPAFIQSNMTCHLSQMNIRVFIINKSCSSTRILRSWSLTISWSIWSPWKRCPPQLIVWLSGTKQSQHIYNPRIVISQRIRRESFFQSSCSPWTLAVKRLQLGTTYLALRFYFDNMHLSMRIKRFAVAISIEIAYLFP